MPADTVFHLERGPVAELKKGCGSASLKTVIFEAGHLQRNPLLNLLVGLCLLPGCALAQFVQVTGFSPASGEPGQQVVISGNNFNGTTAVFFDNVQAAYTVDSNTRITAIVPTTGKTGKISVTQSFTATSVATFTVAPRVESFERQGSPDVVVAAIGDSIQVEGANFLSAQTTPAGTTTVRVGEVTATIVNVTAPSQLVFGVPGGAVSGPISVETYAGRFITTSNLIVSGTAVITSFDPHISPGGAQVQINGGDFTGSTNVFFNGVAAQFNVTSVSQIIATAPTNAGTGVITVHTPNGIATSLSNFVSVGTAPQILGFDPASGKAGDPIVLEGINFSGATNVLFNGVAALFGVTSDSQINAIVPTNIASGPITVQGPGGQHASTNSFGIEPIIDSFDPIAETVGSLIVINGQNLSEVTNVNFAGTIASFTRTGPDQIQTVVPFGATNGPIQVISPAGTNSSVTNFTVTFGIPLITGFSPTNGLPGEEIILTGVHFSGVSNVTFNGVSATSFGVTSDSQISAHVPAEGTTGLLSVFGPAGTNATTNLFYYPPRMTAFAPARGVVGATVTIDGTNFTGTTQVLFSGSNNTKIASIFNIVSDRQISATVPSNIIDGTISVITPGGAIVSTESFSVLARLDSFSPFWAPVSAMVTMNGLNFEKVSFVKFNGVSANFIIHSPTLITAQVPPQTDSGPITLQNTSGDLTTSAIDFVLTKATDTGLILTNQPSLVLQNGNVDVVILVTNRGPSIATELRSVHTFPSAFTINTATNSHGTCVVNGRTITCDIPVLTNGTAATITINAKAKALGSHTVGNTLTRREGELNAGDNSVPLTVPVIGDFDRQIFITPLTNSDKFQLHWNFSAANFNLQARGRLLSVNDPWVTISSDIFTVTQNFAIFHVYTNRGTGASRFFRLIRE